MKGLIDRNQLTDEQYQKIVAQAKKHYENSELTDDEIAFMAQGSLNELIWLFGDNLILENHIY